MLRNIKLCFLFAIFATICYKQAHTSVSYRDRVIGCLYSEVCSSNQVCFDDNAFGRCEELDERGKALSSDYVYQLDRKTLQLLEKELDRLSEERFSWRSAYTQCVLKTVLNERPRIVYDPSACDYLRTDDQQGSQTTANQETDSDFHRPLKASEEDQFVSPLPSSATVKSAASGQVQQAVSSIIGDSLPSSAPRPLIYNKNAKSSPKLADSNVKSKLRAAHLKRTPTLWAKSNRDAAVEDEMAAQVAALSDRQVDSVLQLLLDGLQSSQLNNDDDKQLDTSEYQVLQAVPAEQYLQYQARDIVPYVTSPLIDRKYDQQQQQAQARASVPLRPLYRAVPYTSSRLSPLPRLKYPDEDLLPSQSLQPDDDDIYIVNAPLSALLAAQRPEVRVLRNTDEEQSEEGAKDAEEDLLPVGPLPLDQDVIMVDVIDQDRDSREQEKNDDALIASLLENILLHGEEYLQREKDIKNIEDLLREAAQESSVDSDSDSISSDEEDKLKEDMKEFLLSDINYNNNFDTKMPNFYRKHRYDIKKPGPKYYEEYFFKPDSEDNNNNNNNYEPEPNKPLELDEEETNDEDKSSNEPLLIETQLNSLSDPSASQIQKKDNSIRSSKPVAEGPVKVDAKSENTIIIRSAEEGEETSLEAIDSTHTYVVTDKMLGEEESRKFVQTLEQVFKLPRGTFSNLRKEDFQITFKVNPNYRDLNASQVASRIEDLANAIKEITGYNVKETGIGDKTKLPVVSATLIKKSNEKLINLTLLICSVILAIISAAFVIFLFRRNGKFREKVKGFVKASEDWMSFDYQDLCRQRMQGKSKESKENKEEKQASSSKCSPSGSSDSVHKLKNVDTGLANQHDSSDPAQHTPPSRASTSSWVEEPVSSNMDITTGHIILSYMEDHLKKKDRLDREWEALCAYEADPCATNAAFQKQNASKNRYPDVLAYDHSRVILNDLANASNSDYINANTITDHDPRNPAYIVTQGPLSTTKADFWQMIWEQGSTTIVMLSRLRENGLSMCDRYWPEEGSEIYQNYEVHLVSEHIWCDDYLVRSFYLKNLKTSETRSVTQFHFLSWPEGGIPPNTKSILDFRRKVNKSYKGRSCPIVVHCSDGIGRTGTYILIDMVLNRLAKGAKEIDIAATLEHIRDQRGGMVKNKAQFEFVLLAVAEEVQAILKALAQN